MGDGLRRPADDRTDKAWGSTVDPSALCEASHKAELRPDGILTWPSQSRPLQTVMTNPMASPANVHRQFLQMGTAANGILGQKQTVGIKIPDLVFGPRSRIRTRI